MNGSSAKGKRKGMLAGGLKGSARNVVKLSEDDESPEASDTGDGEQVRCPSCGAWVYEDAGICKKCGNYFTEDDLAGRTPVWIVVGVIVCLGVVVFMWLR